MTTDSRFIDNTRVSCAHMAYGKDGYEYCSELALVGAKFCTEHCPRRCEVEDCWEITTPNSPVCAHHLVGWHDTSHILAIHTLRSQTMTTDHTMTTKVDQFDPEAHGMIEFVGDEVTALEWGNGKGDTVAGWVTNDSNDPMAPRPYGRLADGTFLRAQYVRLSEQRVKLVVVAAQEIGRRDYVGRDGKQRLWIDRECKAYWIPKSSDPAKTLTRQQRIDAAVRFISDCVHDSRMMPDIDGDDDAAMVPAIADDGVDNDMDAD